MEDMGGIGTLCFFSLFASLLIISNAYAIESVSLDPTIAESVQNIELGEMKYNYSIEIIINNCHDHCIVECEIGLYGYPYYSTFSPFYDNGSSLILLPNENGTISWTNHDFVDDIEINIRFETSYNFSISNDQQDDVEIKYVFTIYDDNGNIALDSEDGFGEYIPSNNKEDEENTSCSSSLVVLIGLLMVFYCYTRRKSHHIFSR